MKKPIITVDGPAGAGKSTISRLLAKKKNLVYLDTGAMYRAVALQAKRMNLPFSDGRALYEMCENINIHFAGDGENSAICIDNEDVSIEIRRPEMDMLSSSVSAVKEVRKAMTALQRKIGEKGGLVAEGRDMGTVVFPDADYKFFISATPKVRAYRRYLERKGRNEDVKIEDVEADIRKRDEQDQSRKLAPLKPAKDAVMIDTSNMDLEQVLEKLLDSIDCI
ncbi:MAG: (d)CMP kinase [Candidatus Aminicenantes bacterium]|nr:(d)CMP kinase [Candidatus Aminicenantes bacterium]